MRTGIVWLLSGSAVLGEGRCTWAQAGRFIPPIPTGGGHFPHIPIHFFGGDSDVGAVIAFTIGLIVAAVLLAVAGYAVGWALGGGLKHSKPFAKGRSAQWDTWKRPDMGFAWPWASAPDQSGREARDLILNPIEVAAKAGQTTRLLEFLARRDPRLDPGQLRALVTKVFCLVQQCWEARDYSPVRDLLCPGILANHEGLLRQMRKGHAINRIEGLRVEAVEFVHLLCPEDQNNQQVAALITFEATAYFVDDRSGIPTRGSRSPGLFLEFWVFRRQGERGRLDAIERTHQSDLLQAANRVAGLSAEQLDNVQQSIVL